MPAYARCTALASLTLLAVACDRPTEPVANSARLDTLESSASRHAGRPKRVGCDPDNAGITLPAGFCALVYADLTIGGAPAAARHMAVTPTGDLFVAINAPRNQQPQFGIIGLRDNDGDGRADERRMFSPGLGGSGLAYGNARLYLGANDRVVSFHLPPGNLEASDAPMTIVSGLPSSGDHISKTLVLAGPHSLFVNVGSASNSCQQQNRVAQSPGVRPCPELPIRAGVWKFDAKRVGQTQSDGERWATGLRNAVALAVNPMSGELWAIPHGRDQLFEHWGQFFTQAEDAVLPAEELVRATRGSDTGWPYCYFDAVFERRKALAPEYGGNGQIVSGGGIDCAAFNQPLATFGAHWAPNGMHFYTGSQFPTRYRGGAFIAFHGGFDRAPLPNEGYQVQFVPFAGRSPSGGGETFADGFAGSNGPLPATAQHRPVGIAEGVDGSLFVSDDRGGRIYRIFYVGR